MSEVARQVVDEIVRISSLEVAKMMETRHDALLRKIDNNSKILTDHNFVLSDYWVKSFYKDSSGKENKEYLVSKKGCEFLAHKTTGEKGVLFTVKYMERFEEMERIIKEQKLELSPRDKGILDIVNSKSDIEQAIAIKTFEEVVTAPLIETIEEQKPDVQFANRIRTDGRKVYSISQASKLLKLPYGRNKLMENLRNLKILQSNNEPYQTYIDRDYLLVELNETGNKLVITPRITGKGMKWLENKLRDKLLALA
ncbi:MULTISPECIES: phage regulatory protein/antirepressor Ant [unclassified Clostridioides]|uniref:Rha family transcriptional regulator n=1 Tax=unclassified Clostridioides TaxID=2635829 RepID=UPI001D12B419|nr:phage regulatory protein/antirepressor Ant [Clostridioides sp. ES-W-0018-02]MCC0705374.1 phage regulatory protein/antirepressor Ant [Clostridioides sp. ES-S-0049-02]MCC0713328.1 phage regulatory protein/antirepressor Ant [Clostridioides sp. ES-W-0017-02]